MVRIIKSKLLPLYVRMIKNKHLTNVFNTSSNKRVLLVYTVGAFDGKLKYTHSNLWECRIAGEIFNDLGYQVDVINYNSSRILSIDKYDIVYGMGEAFEKLFSQKRIGQTFINYGTGCSPIWSNIETTKKVGAFSKKSNQILNESSRIISYSQHFQLLLSDHVIVLGNDFVKSTYLKFDNDEKRYSNLNAFYFNFHDVTVENKNIGEARKNFLWFGSAGALHKGLDLCLDYFKTHTDLHLHICGLNVVAEKRFVENYREEIYNLPNIHYHGFVHLGSDKFNEILKLCGYVTFPSVSEGGAVALLNTIGNGALLPIYSKSTGVPFSSYGFEFDEIETQVFEDAITEALAITNEEFCTRANNLQTYVKSEFTLDNYKLNLTKIISDIINEDQA